MTTNKQVISITAHQINSEYRKAKSSMVDSANHILECGRLLIEKKKELGHGNFMPFVKHECDFERTAANYMMKAYQKYQSTGNLTEADALAISRDTWGNKEPIVSKFTGDQESYTPSEYIEPAREVMGSIDLDPASNPFAQKTVQAETYYTADDDGLDKDWDGCVFLNPPYEHPLIEQFIDKLITEYQDGHVKQAILLTNNSADTQWFHKAARAADLICLTEGRISFYKSDGVTRTSPTNGQAFFYFGRSSRKFINAYKQFGLIVQVCD